MDKKLKTRTTKSVNESLRKITVVYLTVITKKIGFSECNREKINLTLIGKVFIPLQKDNTFFSV